MKNKIIYLDNAATTKTDLRVIKAMQKYFAEYYGNPSSLHYLGVEARKAVENARKIIALSINASPEEIFFTSGGTESNNLALKGVAFAFKNSEKNHIITTKVEHKSIIESCKWLEQQGFKVTYLDVDNYGFVNIEQLKKEINEKTILVSIIHANNEIGTINNLDEISNICKTKNVYFHTDACQSYTKVKIDVKKTKLDLISLNAHKIHGPKGIGAIYIREQTKISCFQHGGWQERGMRAGTENVPGIVGFAEAVKLARQEDIKKMMKLRDKLISGILKIDGVKLNGATGEKRLCNNANFSFKYIEGEAIGGLLDLKGVCSSTGSACSERTLEPSHVLKAIGLDHEAMNGSLRLSLSKFTTEKEIDYVIKIMPQIVAKLRKISPFKQSNEKEKNKKCIQKN